MSVRSFRPVMSVATVAVAALGCYLVSLRVAAERAGLEDVETQIVLAQRDIRSLQTEIGTRGRLEQLERWNVRVLALSAPKAEQFVDGGYQLARLARPEDQVDITAPVVLAAAPRPAPAAPIGGDDAGLAERSVARPDTVNRGPASMMHVASYTAPATPAAAAKPTAKPTTKPATKAALPRKPIAGDQAMIKPVKIATAVVRPGLPGPVTGAKASTAGDVARKPSKTAATSREKATH